MPAVAFLHPSAFWFLLPLAAVVAWLLRRGGEARRQAAPVWLFQDEQQRARGHRRFAWRNPLAAGVLLAGVLWIVAWATPYVGRSPDLPALVLLDAGVPAALHPGVGLTGVIDATHDADARWLERFVGRWRKRGTLVHYYVAGCAPAGPFADLAQARSAQPAPEGPALGELLEMLGPAHTQPVIVLGWRAGPTSLGTWHSRSLTASRESKGRLVQASLEGDGQLAVAAVGPRSEPLASGRVFVVLANDTLGTAPVVGGWARLDLSARLVADERFRAVALQAARPRLRLALDGGVPTEDLPLVVPAPRLVWLACEDREWGVAIDAWAGFTVRRVDRSRLPPDAQAWSAWRQRLGPVVGRELFVAVGPPPPALPDSVPWLWIAPTASEHAQLSFGRPPHGAATGRVAGATAADAEPVRPMDRGGTIWQGLDLSYAPQAAELLGFDAGWSISARGRVALGKNAAVLNMPRPLTTASTSEPALVALRLAERLSPAPVSRAGPGLPSPAWRWPATTASGARPAAVDAAGADGRWAHVALLAALASSLLVAVRAPLRRWTRATAVAVLLLLAWLAVLVAEPPLLLVLDASQSCRAQVAARATQALEALGDDGTPLMPAWIAALDGADGRWLLTPASADLPPRDAPGLRAWLDTRLQALPRGPHSRLAPATRALVAAAGLRRARTMLVTDGAFEDAPASLARALPTGVVTLVEAPAGRPGDAAIVALELQARAERSYAGVVADDGGRGAWVELSVDGQLVGRHALRSHATPLDSASGVDAPLHHVELPLPRGSAGGSRISVRVVGDAAAAPDVEPTNDRLDLADDEAPPRVLWTDPDGSERILGPGRTSDPPAARSPGELDSPDVWVLEAAPESLIVALEARLLSALDRGVGLVLLAGPGSWLAQGRTGKQALESRLPVRLRVPQERDPSPTPWMLLLDASGSMASAQDGSSHFERALVALSAALASTRPEEPVGVLAFAERVLATIPPQVGLSREQLQPALQGVRPSGGTRLLPALEAAGRLLRAAPSAPQAAQPPRMLVLSDGITGAEDPLQWEQAAAGCQVIALELGDQASPALRALCVATGGRHRLLRSPDDLTDALTEEARFPARERLISHVDTVLVEDVAWGSIVPPRVAAHLSLARAEGHAPWTLGRLRDPLLALRESGAARVAVLATSAGDPWSPPDAAWDRPLEVVLAWAARRDQPVATWEGADAPRLRLDPGSERGADDSAAHDPSLLLIGASGDTTRLEAIVPGVYRPAAPPPRGEARVVDASGSRIVARVTGGDAAAETRVRGVERERLTQLAASLPPGRAGRARIAGPAGPAGLATAGHSAASPPRAVVLAVATIAWILAAAGHAWRLSQRGPDPPGPRAGSKFLR